MTWAHWLWANRGWFGLAALLVVLLAAVGHLYHRPSERVRVAPYLEVQQQIERELHEERARIDARQRTELETVARERRDALEAIEDRQRRRESELSTVDGFRAWVDSLP